MSSTYAVQTQQEGRHARTRRPAKAPARNRLRPFEIVALMAIAVLLVLGALHGQPQPGEASVTRTVQVQPGQTLWAIAQAHPIDGLTTAQTADAISRSNSLADSTLASGQTLRVPAEDSLSSEMASR